MTISDEVRPIKVEREFHICPNCGYEKGFHVSFQRINAFPDIPVKTTREMFRVILICPNCGARFDVGWKVTVSE
jgi:transcription elongation factor Elf1